MLLRGVGKGHDEVYEGPAGNEEGDGLRDIRKRAGFA